MNVTVPKIEEIQFYMESNVSPLRIALLLFCLIGYGVILLPCPLELYKRLGVNRPDILGLLYTQ